MATNKFGVYDIDGDLISSHGTRRDAERAVRLADDEQQAEIVVRYVAMEPTMGAGGGYIGVDQDGKAVPRTASNAALICRSRCIDAAERLGVPFRE